ncbi:uncharacterized protein LOC120133159 [Hibiscus syriacus]|uniref:uncharacterized protein LOC120133159 n=1 Tax=Hibiscus syriacus TaxID=106335 RepID=UPI0019245899|nr:uncharacterized protein LOC120133159 [Hibiscus syriacus]
MLEEVIPSLKTILETQDDISEIDVTFQDNKLEGSFMKEGCPYLFWAFFPDGVLTGPKGFSLSSYGSEQALLSHFLLMRRKLQRGMYFSGLKNVWLPKELSPSGKT